MKIKLFKVGTILVIGVVSVLLLEASNFNPVVLILLGVNAVAVVLFGVAVQQETTENIANRIPDIVYKAWNKAVEITKENNG